MLKHELEKGKNSYSILKDKFLYKLYDFFLNLY